jgi:membrane fusion protein, multidrug efflux system
MARTIETDIVDTETMKPERGRAEEKAPRRNPLRWIILGMLAIAIAAASAWWLQSLRYESTDDAQVDGHIDLLSARISGTVTYINLASRTTSSSKRERSWSSSIPETTKPS